MNPLQLTYPASREATQDKEVRAACPQTEASTTAKTLDQTEATCEWFDEQEVRWSLRDEGRSDGYGDSESYAERNV